MVQVLLWMWQFPQNLIGLIISYFSVSTEIYKIRNQNCFRCYVKNFPGAISLGNYVILDYFTYHGYDHTKTKLHENGHQIQSMYFGWFYLLLVGIPSICNNIWDRIFHSKWTYEKRSQWYYSRYPEKWADKLGGVKR